MVTIRRATMEDADWMQSSFDRRMGWTKPAGYFYNACLQHATDRKSDRFMGRC